MSNLSISTIAVMVITVIVDVIGYITSNNMFPTYAVILSLISFVLTTIATVVFGQKLVTLQKQLKK